MTVRDQDRGAAALTRRLAGLARGARLSVGISEEAGAAAHPSGGTVAEVAELVEYGTEASPAQSFVRATVDDEEGRVERGLARAAESVAGGRSDLTGALEKVGDELAEKMRSRVLVETGTTRDAIGFTINGSES